MSKNKKEIIALVHRTSGAISYKTREYYEKNKKYLKGWGFYDESHVTRGAEELETKAETKNPVSNKQLKKPRKKKDDNEESTLKQENDV